MKVPVLDVDKKKIDILPFIEKPKIKIEGSIDKTQNRFRIEEGQERRIIILFVLRGKRKVDFHLELLVICTQRIQK
jgi:hypothetical protein